MAKSDRRLQADQVAIARLVPRFCIVGEPVPFAKVEGMLMPCMLALDLVIRPGFTHTGASRTLYYLKCPQHGFIDWEYSEVGDGPPF